MYAKGSPKFNLMQRKALQKKPSPKAMKRVASPKVDKPRAQWNRGLEKSLVDLLHEHDDPCSRGDNGWGSETWNQMVKLFNARNGVNFTKGQIQEKGKELKKDYRALKEARRQSGVSWDDVRCTIIADENLWKNMIITWKRIGKFRRGSFPLYERLGDSYDGHTAEGNYNFTSSEPSQKAGPSQVPDITQVEDGVEEEEAEEVDADELQILEEGDIATARVHENRVAAADPGGTAAGAAAKTKPRKEAKKPKKTGDAMVEVMQQYVNIKKKQAEDEVTLLTKESAGSTNGKEFSISKCISLVHKMEGIARHERARAYKVFKNVENRETFITSAAEDEASAVEWLRSEMDELST